MLEKPTTEDILHQIEAESRARTESVRAMLREEGHLEALREMDKALRDIDLGIHGARATWDALTEPQRRVLRVMVAASQRLVRFPGSKTRYDAGSVGRVATLPTVRNLERRELLSWDGGAFDPEAAAVLTERARFVLKHGPSAAQPKGDASHG